jgi:hypothetical protein
MGVLMADRMLGIRRRTPGALDAHGEPGASDWGPLIGPWPGSASEAADGGWNVSVDPQGWPLAAGDLVVEPAAARSWLVTGADLLVNTIDPTVDYVRVDARERAGTHTEVPATPQPTTRA